MKTGMGAVIDNKPKATKTCKFKVLKVLVLFPCLVDFQIFGIVPSMCWRL